MSADIAAGNTPARARTVWREDLIAALTGFLLITGLFLDGWNHLNLQDGKAGEFLTPWHGLLYTGFNACAVWAITRNTRLRAMMFPSRAKGGASGARGGAPSIDAAKIALLGIGLVGAGMAGDSLTRASGSTGAIAPPFDFLVFTGAGIVFLVALRAALARFDIDRRVALPAMLAVGAAALALFALGGSKTPAVQTAHKAGVAETPGVAQVSSAPAVIHARTHAPARVNRASAPARHARKAAVGSAPAVRVSTSGPLAVATTPSALPTTHASHSAAPVARPVVRHRAAAPVSRPHRTSAPAAPVHKAHRVWTNVAVPDAQAPATQSVTTTTTTTSKTPDTPVPASAPKPSASPTAAPAPASAPTTSPVTSANGGHQGPH
jgi:hypothetical protein